MNSAYIDSIRLTPITVLGAGSWGTALAILLANNGQPVKLWSPETSHIEQMKKERINARYLPDISFPPNLQLFSTLHDALYDTQDILITVPSSAFSEVLTNIKPHLQATSRIVWGTKGLTAEHEFLHVAAERVLNDIHPIPLAVLSGPSFAREVARGIPTAVTVATTHSDWADALSARFNNEYFRIYKSDDLMGVQIGGIVKNILAIAAGMLDGLKLGSNTLAALITRGLVEMTRFGAAYGAKQETLYGLSGLGDLILTCTDNQSRNRRFGRAIVMENSVTGGCEAAIKSIGQVVEGYENLVAVYALAQEKNIEMPITEQVYQVIYEKKSPQLAIQALFSREPKEEH